MQTAGKSMEKVQPDRILLVDDEAALLSGIRRILESEGYAVDSAGCGADGIKIGTAKEFDLALIDLKMPDVNGLEVLSEIRAKYPNTVCFIATAYASYETAVEATKLGADGYILKPFAPDELLTHLARGMEKRRLLLETERLRREREESLLEVAFERTRLKTIISSISEGVLVINRKGEAVYFNPALLNLLGLAYIPIGIPVIEHLPNEIASLVSEKYLAVENQTKTYSTEVEILPNGELIIEASLSPVLQQDKSLAGVVVTLKNITEFKKLELLKSQFVSMVAHELKAPVAASVGFIDVIRQPDLQVTPEQQSDFLNRAHSRLKGLLSMVNDLLDISRMEMSKVTREISGVIVEECIQEVVQLFALESEKAQVAVTVPPPGMTHIIRADKNEIIRLLTNFVSNGIKYNKPGGSLSIMVARDLYYISIIITDTGIGLKPEEQQKLFHDFYRAKNEHTKNIHGTGLGLSIVKRIIEAYAGKISVKSEYGKGTTFTISFPVSHEH